MFPNCVGSLPETGSDPMQFAPRTTAGACTCLIALTDWGLVALAGHALALILTGVAGVAAWATAAVLACLALALRDPAPAATTAPQEPPANPPDPAAVAPLTPRPLWAQTGRDGPPLPPARQ